MLFKWHVVEVRPPPPTTPPITTRPPEAIVTPRPDIPVVTTPKIEFGPKRVKKPFYQEQVYQVPKQDLVRPPRDVGVKLQKQQQLAGKWAVTLFLKTSCQMHSKEQVSMFKEYHSSRYQQVFSHSQK